LSPVLGEYGFLNPVLAAAAMALSSVTVLSNALRLEKGTVEVRYDEARVTAEDLEGAIEEAGYTVAA
jgi:copper chaperone CopZ